MFLLALFLLACFAIGNRVAPLQYSTASTVPVATDHPNSLSSAANSSKAAAAAVPALDKQEDSSPAVVQTPPMSPPVLRRILGRRGHSDPYSTQAAIRMYMPGNRFLDFDRVDEREVGSGEPQLRFLAGDPAMAVNVHTRGGPGPVQQIGFLTNAGGDEILPLYGYETHRNSGRYAYFTTVDRQQHFIKLPLVYEGRECTVNFCRELYGGEQVQVSGKHNVQYTVSIYGNSSS